MKQAPGTVLAPPNALLYSIFAGVLGMGLFLHFTDEEIEAPRSTDFRSYL